MAPSRPRFGAPRALMCLALHLAGAAAQEAPVTRKTVRIDETQNVGKSLPDNDPRFVRYNTGFTPEQVHLTYWGAPSKMVVSFASGSYLLTQGVPPRAPAATAAALVQWGTKKDAVEAGKGTNATCSTTAYVQNQWAFLKSPSYVSPYLSHCLMTGLPAGTQVFYRVGWPEYDSWSRAFNFTTFKDGPNFPFQIGVMADLGLSTYTGTTVDKILESGAQVVLNVGDLPYADNYKPNGAEGTIKDFKYLLSFQPRWDMFGRLMEPLASHLPVMTSTGNHEIEFQSDGTVFAAYNSRYPNPQDPSKLPQLALNKYSQAVPSPDNGLYYSWDVPGTAHFIALTSYIPNDTFSVDTRQYKWLAADLAKVDRKKTPWLIAYFHAPFVSSYEASFKQVECMRLTYEPLLMQYGVDIIFNGHVHAYERNTPVYNFTSDRCGITHITIGCGGKPGEPGSGVKALDTGFIEDKPPAFYCADPKVLDIKPNLAQPIRCTSYQPDLGGFCWNRQPDFSAYREPAFGAATFTLLNATHADWKWLRYEGTDKAVVADSVVINRLDGKGCKNRPYL